MILCTEQKLYPTPDAETLPLPFTDFPIIEISDAKLFFYRPLAKPLFHHKLRSYVCQLDCKIYVRQ